MIRIRMWCTTSVVTLKTVLKFLQSKNFKNFLKICQNFSLCENFLKFLPQKCPLTGGHWLRRLTSPRCRGLPAVVTGLTAHFRPHQPRASACANGAPQPLFSGACARSRIPTALGRRARLAHARARESTATNLQRWCQANQKIKFIFLKTCKASFRN